MDHERPDIVYYHSEENARFSEALTESIVIPAYFAAIHQAAEAGMDEDSHSVTAESEHYFEGNKVEYDFLALRDQKTIYITSTIHQAIKELSFAGALLIHNEILYSTVYDGIKDRYAGKAGELYANAEVETFTRRIFRIEVTDEMVIVRVHTYLGYYIDGHEIPSPITHDEPMTELDEQFEKSFEREDINEIIRALLAMGLIGESDVRHFLDQQF